MKNIRTKEECREFALIYNAKKDFLLNDPEIYRYSYKRGWLNDICSHMIEIRKPIRYWTFERCKEEALKFNTITEFSKKSNGAYDASYNNKWLDEICGHMVSLHKPDNYWTFERCSEEALKYKSKNEFQKKSASAFQKAYVNNWVNDICLHMVRPKQHNYKWSLENCKNEALKFNSRIEFSRKSGGAYNAARENNWIDDICKHMSLKISDNNNDKYKKWIIYSYIIFDKYVYTGASDNLIRRHNDHINPRLSDVLYRKICEKNIDVRNLIKLSSIISKDDNKNIINREYNIENFNSAIIKLIIEECNITTRNEASILEGFYLEKRINEGYEKLNILKTGNINGCVKKWYYESVKKKALKYTNKKDFRECSYGAYKVATFNGWLDDICSHMKSRITKPYNYWTKERCHEEALKYKNRNEFNKKCSGACYAANKNGWYNEICAHMTQLLKPVGYWTYEHCKEESILSKNREEFSIKSSTAYNYSRKNGWLDEFFPKNKKTINNIF